MLMMKHDTDPDSIKQSIEYTLSQYVKQAALGMLSTRFAEAAQKADCPFVGASAGDGNYIFAKTKDAFSLDVAPKDMGKTADAVKAAYLVVKQAADHGFTATEYARFKESMLSSLDKMWEGRDKRSNTSFYNQALGWFLSNEPMPSLEFNYKMMKKVVPMIPLETINQVLPQLVAKSDSNLVILNFNNEKEGAVYPTADQLLGAVHEARATKVDAYVDNVKNEPIMKNLPKPGKIKKEVKSKKFDYQILSLSNGVTVLLKKTDYKKDQVTMSGTGGSGEGNYGKADFANLQMFDSVIGNSGLGDFGSIELGKALAGKIANASLSLGARKMSLGGSATPKDVETMLQLAYLYFTNIKKDQDAFNSLMQQNEVGLKNRDLDPTTAFYDSITKTVYDNNWRMRPFLLKDLKNVSYDRILQMAKERTANANGWVFEIIGNFDEATIRPLICQYLGSLPSKGKNPEGKREVVPTKKNVDNTFTRKMETPKSMAQILWFNSSMPYSMERGIQASITGQVLSMVYLKQIREEASAAYSCGAQAGMSQEQDGYHMAQIAAYCPMKPEKKDIAIQIMNQAVKDLAVKCDAEMLSKVQKLMLKQYDSALKTNGYWASVVWDNYTMNRDEHTDYVNTVKAQTPEKISAFVKEFLAGANKVSVIMLPE